MFNEELPIPQDIGLTIIHDPSQFVHYFQQEYEGVRKHLLSNLVAEKDNLFAQTDQHEKLNVLRELEDLFDDKGYSSTGGQIIQMGIYKPFALERGFTKKTKWGDAALLIYELNEEQISEWERYLTSIPFTENRRTLLAGAISNIPFPTITTKYKPNNVPLASELENAKRRITFKLLPNISDNESQVALGQRYTAETVRTSVTPNGLQVN